MPLDKNGNPDVCRVHFTPLTDDQKAFVEQLKLAGNELLAQIATMTDGMPSSEELRLISLAKTNIEQGMMWAIKAATT